MEARKRGNGVRSNSPRNGDRFSLRKYGNFTNAILKNMSVHNKTLSNFSTLKGNSCYLYSYLKKTLKKLTRAPSALHLHVTTELSSWENNWYYMQIWLACKCSCNWIFSSQYIPWRKVENFLFEIHLCYWIVHYISSFIIILYMHR